MEGDSVASSESEYLPGSSDEENNDDSDSDCEFDDDTWGVSSEPVMEDEWEFLSDIFC